MSAPGNGIVRPQTRRGLLVRSYIPPPPPPSVPGQPIGRRNAVFYNPLYPSWNNNADDLIFVPPVQNMQNMVGPSVGRGMISNRLGLIRNIPAVSVSGSAPPLSASAMQNLFANFVNEFDAPAVYNPVFPPVLGGLQYDDNPDDDVPALVDSYSPRQAQVQPAPAPAPSSDYIEPVFHYDEDVVDEDVDDHEVAEDEEEEKMAWAQVAPMPNINSYQYSDPIAKESKKKEKKIQFIDYSALTVFNETNMCYDDKLTKDDDLYYSLKKKTFYRNPQFTEPIFPLSEYVNDAWLLPTDFGPPIALSDEDSLIKTAELTSLYEQVSIIMNEAIIDSKELDVNFKKYIKSATAFVGFVVEKMFDNNNWKFEPLEKFLWIYLMVACRHESRAIKYLVNSPYYNKKILTQTDIYGSSCLLVACKTDNAEIIANLNLNKDLTVDMFKTEYFSIPLIMYVLAHPNIFKYVKDNIPNMDQCIFSTTNTYTGGITPFLFACQFSPVVAESMLHDQLMTQEYFDISCVGVNPVIIASFYHPDLLKKLLESKYCTQKHVDQTYATYGTILNILSHYHPTSISTLLESKHMTKELMSGVMTTRGGNKINILLTVKDKKMFQQIVESPHFDSKLLTVRQANGESILFNLLDTNKEGFHEIINSPHCTKELMSYKNSRNENILHYSAISDVAIFNKLLEKPDLIGDILFDQDNYNKRVPFMTVFANPINKDKIATDLMIRYLTTKLLDITDIYGFNLFCYVCKHAPSIAPDLIKNGYMTFDTIANATPSGLPMLSNILCTCTDVALVKNIMSCDVVMTDFVSATDFCAKNTLFMEVVRVNPGIAHAVLDSKLCTDSALVYKNVEGDNLLIYAIKYGAEDVVKLLLSKSCVGEQMKCKNLAGHTPFLIACQTGYNMAHLLSSSPAFDEQSIGDKTLHNATTVMQACMINDFALVMVLLDHPKMTQETFMQFSDSKMSCIMIALTADTEEIAEYILNHKLCSTEFIKKSVELYLKTHTTVTRLNVLLNSKYFTKDILLCKNSRDQNMLTATLLTGVINPDTKLILKSKYVSKELLQCTDNYGRNALYFVHDVDTALLVIDSDYFDNSILRQVDNEGLTPVHYHLLTGNKNVASIIMGSEECTVDILKIKAKSGSNILTNMYYYNVGTEILCQPTVSSDDLLDTDLNNRSCLHNLMHQAIDNTMRYEKLTELLKSDKCSSALLELQDVLGDTFLMSPNVNDKIFLDVLESVYCKPELLVKVNRTHENLITYFADKAPGLIAILVNHSKATKELLKPEDKLCNPFASTIAQASECYLELMECKFFDNECMNKPREPDKMTPLAICVATGNVNENRVEILIKSEYDLTPSFKKPCALWGDMNLLAASATLATPKIFKLLLDSAYVTPTMFTDKYNELGHTAVTNIFMAKLDIVKEFVESKYWTEEVMYEYDVDHDFLLLRTHRRPNVVSYLLNSDRCNHKFITMENKLKMLCSHYFALEGKSEESFKNMLNAKNCVKEFFSHQDVFGRTSLHIVAHKMPEILLLFAESAFYSPDLFTIQDNNKKNVLMILIQHNPQVALSLLLLLDKFESKELFSQQDIHGNNILFYACQYSYLVLEKLLESKHITQQVFGHRNNNFESVIMYASRYNSDAVKLLLKNKHIDSNLDLLTSTHTDYASALTVAARYQPLAVKYILSHPNLSWKVVHSQEDKKDFIEIACMYNAESVKCAIDSKYDLSEHINDHDATAMILAAKYQPDAVKYILESKYVTAEVFKYRKDKRNCVDEAFDFQPRALLYMINSKLATPELLNQPDAIGYRLIHKLQQIYPELTNLKNVKDNRLVDYTNTANFEEYDATTCNICCAYKTRVAFSPCFHTACIGCAFKLKDCHLCRMHVDKKNVIYEQ